MMFSLPLFLLLFPLSLAETTSPSASTSSLPIPFHPPISASAPLPQSFVSFAIEFSSFSEYAGNTSNPNNFSYSLLRNIQKIQGSYPIIRVGGNTQDYALLNTSQREAFLGSYDLARSHDYPTVNVSIGPSFYESYLTWPNVTYTHGFNLAKSNTSSGIANLLASVPYACRALQGHKITNWELGNEPDLYPISAQGPVRPLSWNESDYVREWLTLTRQIKHILSTHPSCKHLPTTFLAPSFGGTANYLNPITTWSSGLNADSDISLISSHNYIGGATQPGVTLQGTLMNHSSTVSSISHQLNVSRLLSSYTLPSPHSSSNPNSHPKPIPFILSETSSLYNAGAPALSNTFGAALWTLDFTLYCAAKNISRVHMQQGTNFRYSAWQPVRTGKTSIGTKAPYYGSIAAAEGLGNLMGASVRVVEVGGLESVFEAAYATYVSGRLARIIVVQMREYNSTTHSKPTPKTRASEAYSFQLPSSLAGREVSVRRLTANGSDAISGITFDGYSYNYELDHGRPVLLANVTRGERVMVGSGGVVSLDVPWSSAAILDVGT